MKLLLLSQGQRAILDDEDFDHFRGFSWFYRGERDGKQGYVVRNGRTNEYAHNIYLHREIMAAPKGFEVIFLNHDRLDCRKVNLKVVTKAEARQHHRVRKDSKTRAKGVRRNSGTNTWSPYLYRDGRAIRIGTYRLKADAEAAYEEALNRENPELHSAPDRIDRWSVHVDLDDGLE